jgi:hypothetical protein
MTEDDQAKQLQTLLLQLATLNAQVSQIACDVTELKQALKTEYVRRAEFEPIKNMAYAFVALVLVTVIGALLSLVIHNNLNP